MAIDYTKRDRTAPAPASLSKVTLTKAAPVVSLTKQGSSTGVLRVNLNWNSRPEKTGGGFFTRWSAAGAIDLDLGCLYEFTDGSKGVVQALGNSFAASPTGVREKVIWLDGGRPVRFERRRGEPVHRSRPRGEDPPGDRVRVHPRRRPELGRCGRGRDPVPGIGSADRGAPRRVVRRDPDLRHSDARVDRGRAVGAPRGQLPRRGQRQLDEAYGWGLRWTAGRK